jgi:hypothetical protein
VTLIGALAQIGGDKALAAITGATTATEPEVKAAAVTALSDTWAESNGRQTLLTLAKTDPEKSYRIQALRGFIRLVGQDERMPVSEKVNALREGMMVAERPEEKRQILGVLRDCRIPEAVELTAGALEDNALSEEATDTLLYLAAPQRKGNRNLPPVKGPAVTAALNKVIQRTKDENIKAQATKLL